MTEISKINRTTVPGLREFFCRRKQEVKSEINSCMVGIIEDFDADEQTASISVAFKKVLKEVNQTESDNASDKIVEYPLLVRCPVVFINGGDSYLTFPIAKGDECLIFFCDKDIDGWFSSGTILPPNSERIHDLSDGIALVGIKSLKHSLSDYSTAAVKLYSDIKLKLQAVGSLDLSSGVEAILRGTEVALGIPVDSVPEGSTPEIRRIWVVTSVVGNQVTLTERRISLTIPTSPQTRVITVQ